MSGQYPDMSDYVVHFTKQLGGHTAYENALSILGNRTIRAANPFGAARNEAWLGDTQKCVCLSEVPLHELKRLAAKRSRYGLGFRKNFVVSRGGGPIMYAYKDTPHQQALTHSMANAIKAKDAQDPIWKLAPFIDAPGVYPNGKYMFEWEREWRHVGDLKFDIADVAFLIIPEELHGDARAFFEDAYHENTGPHYLCPYLDPSWDQAKVSEALAKGSQPPGPPKSFPSWAE